MKHNLYTNQHNPIDIIRHERLHYAEECQHLNEACLFSRTFLYIRKFGVRIPHQSTTCLDRLGLGSATQKTKTITKILFTVGRKLFTDSAGSGPNHVRTRKGAQTLPHTTHLGGLTELHGSTQII